MKSGSFGPYPARFSGETNWPKARKLWPKKKRAVGPKPRPPEAGRVERGAARTRLPMVLAAEQRQEDLRTLVGDAERLDAELLLDLQGLQLGAFLGEIGIHQ